MANASSLSSGVLSSSVTNGLLTMPGQPSTSGPVFSRTVSSSSSAVHKTSDRPIASSTATIVASNTTSAVTSTKASRTSSKVATTPGSSSEIGASIPSMSVAVSSSPPKAITSKNNSPVVSLAASTPIMPTSATSRAPAVSSSSHVSSSPVVSTKPASLAQTSSVVHPPAPPSKPPAQPTSPPSSSTHPATSTLTSVTVVKAPTTPKTSTITKTADTTLSSAVAVTTTDAKGAKIITTPPLVTLFSTSTESGGALTTVTNVVANPPNLGSTKALTSNNGILHRQGVLAGICVVVGLVAATIIIGLIFFVRRSNRLRRRRRWLAGMQHQHPSSLSGDPFRDPQDSFQAGPTMRSVATSHEDVQQWDHSSGGSHLHMQEPMSHDRRNFFGGVSIVPDPHPTLQVVNPTEGGRYEYSNARLAYTTDLTAPMAPFKRHSMTPSSPSIYPATLPPDENDGHEAEDRHPEPSQKELVSPVSAVPPRPPRSHLRESAKLGSYAPPLTPPDSSHTSSQPPSPVSEPTRPQDVFVRRTILDVRHR